MWNAPHPRVLAVCLRGGAVVLGHEPESSPLPAGVTQRINFSPLAVVNVIGLVWARPVSSKPKTASSLSSTLDSDGSDTPVPPSYFWD
ncbi:hypothetical protein CEPID_11640 [Corynebacterium epidermidicanis]|uniref:Uncharacterized protein n=1 Tax=Corynebacterium epidermidicanis TaxID=1050174 RepID=A0A0G3GSN2_9CORY|nr:hypothetical protein CEPID_11640 [Corynebacterium epidermidicanis]